MKIPSLRNLIAILGCCACAGVGSAANNIVSGSGELVLDGAQHQNGNFYDQVLLTGPSVTLRTDGTKVLRCSFLDPNGDIVQAEFAGPGLFTIELDPATYVAAAPAAKYNQPGTRYVTGKPTITIEQNTADTYVSVFTVGKATAVNQTLFPEGQTYDGVADVALLKVTGSALGAVRAGNVRFSSESGLTGIFAPNTDVKHRAIVHNVVASGAATPVLQFGAGSAFELDAGSLLLAGGDLVQPNGASIDITSGNGETLASIVTVANIRSDGSNLQRVTIASTVTWISGGSGTVLIDGTAVVDPNTGGSSGAFAANFSDMLASENSPFNFDGAVDIKWVFSGGNNGTWSVETSMTTQGLTIKTTMTGTYVYSVSNDGGNFSFTMNYDQISTNTGFGPPLTLTINAASNPPLPKTIAMTVTNTGAGAGTYVYTLTMSDGKQTEFSGNYNADAPLSLPTS